LREKEGSTREVVSGEKVVGKRSIGKKKPGGPNGRLLWGR